MKISLKRLLPVFAGITGAGAILYGTAKYGAGMSPDSAFYVSAARSLVEGNGYFVFTGKPMTLWPPLFPTLLALAGPAGIDPAVTARYLNAASFGGIIFLSGTWLNHKLKNGILALLGLALVAFSEPLFSVSLWILSEPVFIFLTVAFLIVIEKYQEDGRMESLLYSAILAALAVLTRYSGVSVIMAGIVIIFTKREKNLYNKFVHGAIFSMVSMLPLLVWTTRNYLLTASPMGPRAPSMFSLSQNVYLVVKTLTGWFLPEIDYQASLIILSLTVIAMALPLASSIMKKGGEMHERQMLTPFTVFLVVYIAWLTASATLVAFDPVDSRFLLPVYAPMVMLAAYICDGICERVDKKYTRKFVYYCSILLLSLMLIRQGYVYLEEVKCNNENGTGILSVKQWRESELILLLKGSALTGSY